MHFQAACAREALSLGKKNTSKHQLRFLQIEPYNHTLLDWFYDWLCIVDITGRSTSASRGSCCLLWAQLWVAATQSSYGRVWGNALCFISDGIEFGSMADCPASPRSRKQTPVQSPHLVGHRPVRLPHQSTSSRSHGQWPQLKRWQLEYLRVIFDLYSSASQSSHSAVCLALTLSVFASIIALYKHRSRGHVPHSLRVKAYAVLHDDLRASLTSA